LGFSVYLKLPGNDYPYQVQCDVVDMVLILDIEMKHGEVHDESKDAYEVLELGEGLQTENEEGQEHLLLVDMETVQEEGE